MVKLIIVGILVLAIFIVLLRAMPSKVRKGCIGIMTIVILVFVAFVIYIITRPKPPKPNARFHNSKEIANYYGVIVPDIILVDSDYSSFDMPAFFTEYYKNTYIFPESVSMDERKNAVKMLNNLGMDKTGDGDVEAQLLEDGDGMEVDSGNTFKDINIIHEVSKRCRVEIQRV